MAGAACWIAPFIQQITGRPGNLRMLVASLGTRQPAGTAFGLKALSASVLPPTVWWRPAMSFRLEGIARVIGGGTPAFGLAVLVLTAALLAVAVRPLRSRRLAALAVVSLLTSGAVLATYSSIPEHNIGHHTQNYLLVVLLPAGLLVWLTAGAAAVLAARRVTGRAGLLAAVRPAAARRPGRRRRIHRALGRLRHRPRGPRPDRAGDLAGGGPAGPGVGCRDTRRGSDRHPPRRSAHRADAACPAAEAVHRE